MVRSGIGQVALGVLAIAGFAPVASADDVTSSGPLGLRAPAGLVLGRDASAIVHLRAADGPIRLVSSAGTMSALDHDGDDVRATLTLPSTKYPQIAIVAAVSDDGTIRDWLAIPLAGQARVRVVTARGASVIVRAAGVTFGPMIAGRDGVAQVPIVVPPGVTTATTLATNVKGNTTERQIQLGAYPFSQILAACPIAGDRVLAFAITPTGSPSSAPLSIAASAGRVSAPEMLEPGIFEARFAGADATSDTAAMMVRFSDGTGSPASCEIRVPPEVPTRVRVTADRTAFVAGTGLPIRVTVSLSYPGRRRPLAVGATLDVDTGSTTTLTRDGGGGWQAAWKLPDAFHGRHRARIRVHVAVPGSPILSAEADVALAPGAATRVETDSLARMTADGETTATVVVRVLDRWGNPIASARPRGHGLGTVGPFALQPDSSFTARYVAPRSREATRDELVLVDDASGVTASLAVRLTPLPRRVLIAAQVGYLTNLGRLASPIVMLSADVRLPVFGERVVAGVEAAVDRAGFDASDVTGETVAVNVTSIPVLARLAYRMPLGPVELWAGAGVGGAAVSSTASSSSTGRTDTRDVSLAASGFVGGATRAGPGWFTVEAAYLRGALRSGPVQGSIGGLAMTAGYALGF